MRLYQMADAVRYGLMNTEELRETFLLEEMFEPGEIELAYVDLDRTVIGAAVPTPTLPELVILRRGTPVPVENTICPSEEEGELGLPAQKYMFPR